MRPTGNWTITERELADVLKAVNGIRKAEAVGLYGARLRLQVDLSEGESSA